MQILLTTLNAKYIHKNLALRWLYVTRPLEYQVDIKEFTINDDIDHVLDQLDLSLYDVIGLSVYIFNSEKTKQLITKIKQINKTIRVILGGPEVYFDNDEWFDLDVEAIVVGEGEKAFWDYLKDNDVTYVKTEKSQTKSLAKTDLKWLEQFESPYFLSFDQSTINNRYLYIESSRGCPFNCTYCLSSTDTGVRFFSLDYLLSVFDKLCLYKIRQVKFLDRTFNANNERAFTLLEYLNRLDTKSNFHMELVGETLNDKILDFICERLKKERFRFEIGVQSFNIKTLRAINRYTNISKLLIVLTRLVESKIIVHTDLIAGLPYEDLESFINSYDQLFMLKPKEIQVGILKMLKGTLLTKDAQRYDIIYDHRPVYQIVKNSWLSEEDIVLISKVDVANEKCYNSQRLRHTINELIDYHDIKPFYLMKILYDGLSSLGHSYQRKEFYLSIYNELIKHFPHELIKGLILVDYYRMTKQRPQWLFYEDQKNDDAYLFLKKKKFVNDHILDNYCVITSAIFDGEKRYQLIVYNRQQLPAKTYMIDIDKDMIEEVI